VNNDKTNVYIIDKEMEPHALKRVEPGPRDNDILILMRTSISVQRSLSRSITSWAWRPNRRIDGLLDRQLNAPLNVTSKRAGFHRVRDIPRV